MRIRQLPSQWRVFSATYWAPKHHGRSGDPAIWYAVPGRNHPKISDTQWAVGIPSDYGLIHTACIGEDFFL